MKRPESRDGREAMSHPRGAWFWAAAVCGLFAFMAGCTGKIGAMASGSAGASNPAGTGNSAGSGAGGGQSGGSPGTAGQGSTGLGGDPYAIPSSPPAAVLVATPRMARLSRQQWSNAVRDLLKLTDISDIDSGVTGDALMGFDNEADALFVTEQLRAQLFDASEKLADKVTGDATALARLVPANAPTDTAGQGQGVHHRVRTARVPAAAHRRGGDHARRALQSRRRRSTPASMRSRPARAW